MQSTSLLRTAGLSATFILLITGSHAAPAPNSDRLQKRQDIQAADANIIACAVPWQSSTVYTGGQTASENNLNYLANWWTQGNDPSTSNGGAGSGQPWTLQGPCTSNGGKSNNANKPKPKTTTKHHKVTTTTKTTISISTSTSKSTSTSTSTNKAKTTTTTTSTSTSTASIKPNPTPNSNVFFSPYKDVTINTNWNTDVISTKVTGSSSPESVVQAIPNLPALTWSFATGECGSENWGGIPASAFATANVANFSQAGIKYILSTGGAGGKFTCTTDAGFSAFIDRYASDSLAGVDFDIESGQSQSDIDNLVARVKTAQQNAKYSSLRFSFTIATFGGSQTQSLGSMGQKVMESIQNARLTNYYINLMTMDYGSATPSNCIVVNSACEMGASATQAAENLKAQYSVPYSQIELTPMIGGNDSPGEIFTLADVQTVATYAVQKGLGGVHFWSLDRDVDCPEGSSSATCNSYGQAGTLGFFNAFLKAL